MKNFTITPKLVHKDSMDDVLLCQPRLAFPLQIENNVADQWKQAGLTHLLALYQSDDKKDHVLRLALTDNHQGLTSSFGRTIPSNSTWEPYRALPYQIIETEFSPQQLKAISLDMEKADDTIAGLFRSTSYQMLNQADHYFFYRKDHEHVPGIMLIEAQRQAVYAHVYTMTEYVRGEVTISLNECHCEFYGYVDLMYPVELVVDDLQVDQREHARKHTYRVTFFQRGYLVAMMDSVVSIINMNQFKQMRNLFMHEKNTYEYMPIHSAKVRCILVDMNGKEYSAECVSLSRDYCVTICDHMVIDHIRSIKVSSDGLTFDSSVELEEHSGSNAIWRFPRLNQDQLLNMGGIIKRKFILKKGEDHVFNHQ